VFASFQKRFQQVFNCKCAFINTFDKTKVLERIFGEGEPLTYPYAYFEIQTFGANKDWYSTQRFVRKGLIVNVDSDSTVQKVRVLPANFDINITYVTNKFESVEQGSVTAFARRWLLAYRAGYLKSTINYGRLAFNIGATLSETVQIPSLENIVESETSYKLTTNITLHGYVSEPMLAIGGKVNTINVQSGITGTNPRLVSSQVFTFPTN
jgi:hypothetical protein